MIQKAIHQLVERADLDFDTTKAVMDEIMRQPRHRYPRSSRRSG